MGVILECKDFKGQLKGKSYALSHLDEADCSLPETENMHQHSSPPSAARSDEDSLKVLDPPVLHVDFIIEQCLSYSNACRAGNNGTTYGDQEDTIPLPWIN